MTSVYEIIFNRYEEDEKGFEIGDPKLYTTKNGFDHSTFADSVDEEDLQPFTKENAKDLIGYLREIYFSEPTHIKVYFDYRDGMHEYQETSEYPLMGKWDVDYDNLGEHGLYALFVLGEISEESIKEAKEDYSDVDDMYWDGNRLMGVGIEMITKEE